MVDAAALEVVRAAMKACPPRSPSAYDRVYKEECMFSFDTASSPGGLYINLSTWQAFGEGYVELDHKRSGGRLYLLEKARQVPVIPDEAANTAAPEKLAIGGEGGFQVDGPKHTVEKEQWLVVLPEKVCIPLPAPELPEVILNSITSIAGHDSASLEDETAVWEEERRESKYAANLIQLEEGMGKWGRKIPSDPSKWCCDESGVTENLWLNLSTGFIGSGRANFDGSGGNGAAIRHFEATGKQFPLAVKLGTITARGADVFSYAADENEMVTDPKLAEHLAHWGINMVAMEKTEKTMSELEIDMNMSFEFDKITESGSALQPLSGPGFVGLKNLGNSCYMNSVLQLLWTVDGVQQRYAAAAPAIFESAPADPSTDLPTQMAKLGLALRDARTGQPVTLPAAENPDEAGATVMNAAAEKKIVGQAVKPQFFKSLVGRGHPEFSSARQQDAPEYFQYLLDQLTRAERAAGARLGEPGALPSASAFEFSIETRTQCSESGRVSYKRDAPTNILSLNIPLEAAANKEEVEEYQEQEAKRAKLKKSHADAYIQQDSMSNGSSFIAKTSQEERVLPRVPLAACIQRWAADEEMGDYYSEALGRKTRALKRQRMASFPPYLLVQVNRYYLASDWTSRKMEVLVDVPEKLVLEPLRGKGLQPGEELQPEDSTSVAPEEAPAVLQADPEIVEALMGVGLSENGSKRAALATQNGGKEVSMDWALSHMEDPDFNDPLPAPSSASGAVAFSADPESIAMLASMGFTDTQATAALKACNGSLERAADWLFSHAGDDVAIAEAMEPAGAAAATTDANLSPVQDGEGRYRLTGFISHMGANTACGHYVCHLYKDGQWVIYNDDKVAVSEHPPKDLGYLYLFRRDHLV